MKSSRRPGLTSNRDMDHSFVDMIKHPREDCHQDTDSLRAGVRLQTAPKPSECVRLQGLATLHLCSLPVICTEVRAIHRISLSAIRISICNHYTVPHYSVQACASITRIDHAVRIGNQVWRVAPQVVTKTMHYYKNRHGATVIAMPVLEFQAGLLELPCPRLTISRCRVSTGVLCFGDRKDVDY